MLVLKEKKKTKKKTYSPSVKIYVYGFLELGY